jgi:hypothetical protein
MWRKGAGFMGRPKKNVERIDLEKHRNAAAMGAQVTPARFDLQTVFSHLFGVSRRAVDVARSAALLLHRAMCECECGGAHPAHIGRYSCLLSCRYHDVRKSRDVYRNAPGQ